MEYRINQKTNDKVSIIGLGSGVLCEKSKEEAVSVLKHAYRNGINYFDLAGGSGELFQAFGEVFSGTKRKKIYYQLHFGAVYEKGKYGWSIDRDIIQRNISRELEALGTDYIDYGFIHCMDEQSVWNLYKKRGILDLILELKKQGVIRHLGLSTHTPKLAHIVMEEVDISMLMFSINAAYDCQHGTFANGTIQERNHLYQTCENRGIGISVMKPYAGGQLLHEKQSIFGKAMTEVQCLKYALDKSGVLTVLPGVSDRLQLDKVLHYMHASKEELSYGKIVESIPQKVTAKCVYCNHCAPCPENLNIGLINKYYDLTLAGDEMARSHYKNLKHHASDCIGCGHCNQRCPFGVGQRERMKEIVEFMGV